jgi:hypothetical protein
MTSMIEREHAAALVSEALIAIHRLRTAWPWLAELTAPGARTERPTRPPVEGRRAEIREAEWHRDRTAAYLATKARRVPGGVKPTAAAIGPVQVRASVTDDIARLADRLYRHVAGDTDRLEWPVLDHQTVGVHTVCRVCNGTGEMPKPRWWGDLNGPWPPTGPKPLSKHAREEAATRPLAPRCTACQDGIVHTTETLLAADRLLYTAIGLISSLLQDLDSQDAAADALRTLDRCDRAVREAVGAQEDRRSIPAPCPCCRQRTLYAEVSSPDPEGWVIRCSHPGCKCAGGRCACRRPARFKGRRHMWPAAEWHTPGGLADLLGIDLPDLVDSSGNKVLEWTDIQEVPMDLAHGIVRRHHTSKHRRRVELEHVDSGTAVEAQLPKDATDELLETIEADLFRKLVKLTTGDEVSVYVRVVVPAAMTGGTDPEVFTARGSWSVDHFRQRAIGITGLEGAARAVGRAARATADTATAAAGDIIRSSAEPAKA